MQLNTYAVLFITLGCLSVAMPSAMGQGRYHPNNDVAFEDASPTVEHTEKKEPSIFRRPAQDDPTDQFTHAEDLEDQGRWRRARRAYDTLVRHWHDSPEAPKAQFKIALLLYNNGKYRKAFDAFQYLVDFYAGRFPYADVLDYQLRIANHVVADRWGDVLFLPGFPAPERALPLLKQLIDNAPNWDKAPSVRMSIGMIHEDLNELEQAVTAYETVEHHHPDSDEAKTAAFRKAYCLYQLSEKTPRDEKQCRAALSALASFLAHYKKSANQAEAETYLQELKSRLAEMYYQRARFYDTIAKRPAAALIAYRDFLKKFPAAKQAHDAHRRMQELKRQVKE